jgi:putative transposase
VTVTVLVQTVPIAAFECSSQPPNPVLRRPFESAQYAADAYTRRLIALGIKPSMSRTGCCYDNAPMESFFHTLKVELVHQRRWATREEARRDLFAYIEGYYNRRRIHSALGYLTPEQAERNAA